MRSLPPRAMLSIAGTELRLQFRGAGLWACLAITDAILALELTGAQGIASSAELAGDFLSGVLPPASLAYLFLLGGMARHERLERCEELLDTLGHSNPAWIGGKVLAALALLVAIGAQAMLALAAFQAWRGLAPVEPGVYIREFVAGYLPVAAYLAAAGIAAGTLLPGPFLAYPILAGYWALAVILLPGLVQTSPLKWLVAADYTGRSRTLIRLSTVGGYYPYEGLVALAPVLYAGLALGVLVLVYLVYKRRRESRRHPAIAALVLVLALAVAGSAFAGQVAFWRGMNGDGVALQAALDAARESALAAQADPGLQAAATALVPLSFDVGLELDPAASALSGRATVTLRNDSPSPVGAAVFTLKPGLAVRAAAAAPLTQDGAIVRVELSPALAPGEERAVSLEYSGRVRDWIGDFRAEPHGLRDYIARDISLLRSGSGWYPLPGICSPAVPALVLRPGNIPDLLMPARMSHAAAAFRLEVVAPAGQVIATGLPLVGEDRSGDRWRFRFAAPSARDVYVAGAPYERLSLDGRTLYLAPVHARAAENIDRYLEEHLNFYSRLVPLAPAGEIVELPGFAMEGSGALEAPLAGALALPGGLLALFHRAPEEVELTDWTRVRLETSILQLWWPDRAWQTGMAGPFKLRPAIVDAAAQYMHLESEAGAGIYNEAMAFWREVGDGRIRAWPHDLLLTSVSEEKRDAILALDAVRQAYGLDGVGAVLRRLREAHMDDGATWRDMAAAVEALPGDRATKDGILATIASRLGEK